MLGYSNNTGFNNTLSGVISLTDGMGTIIQNGLVSTTSIYNSGNLNIEGDILSSNDNDIQISGDLVLIDSNSVLDLSLTTSGGIQTASNLVSPIEISYISGATSNIQTQLNNLVSDLSYNFIESEITALDTSYNYLQSEINVLDISANYLQQITTNQSYDVSNNLTTFNDNMQINGELCIYNNSTSVTNEIGLLLNNNFGAGSSISIDARCFNYVGEACNSVSEASIQFIDNFDYGASISFLSKGIGNPYGQLLPLLYLDSGGSITFYDCYTFPNVDGSNNDCLITDGSGNINWDNRISNLSLDASGNNYFLNPLTIRYDTSNTSIPQLKIENYHGGNPYRSKIDFYTYNNPLSSLGNGSIFLEDAALYSGNFKFFIRPSGNLLDTPVEYFGIYNDGTIKFNNSYIFPASTPSTNGQCLITDSSSNLLWDSRIKNISLDVSSNNTIVSGSLNGISESIYSYLSGLTSNIQSQFDEITSNLIITTNYMSTITNLFVGDVAAFLNSSTPNGSTILNIPLDLSANLGNIPVASITIRSENLINLYFTPTFDFYESIYGYFHNRATVSPLQFDHLINTVTWTIYKGGTLLKTITQTLNYNQLFYSPFISSGSVYTNIEYAVSSPILYIDSALLTSDTTYLIYGNMTFTDIQTTGTTSDGNYTAYSNSYFLYNSSSPQSAFTYDYGGNLQPIPLSGALIYNESHSNTIYSNTITSNLITSNGDIYAGNDINVQGYLEISNPINTSASPFGLMTLYNSTTNFNCNLTAGGSAVTITLTFGLGLYMICVFATLNRGDPNGCYYFYFSCGNGNNGYITDFINPGFGWSATVSGTNAFGVQNSLISTYTSFDCLYLKIN